MKKLVLIILLIILCVGIPSSLGQVIMGVDGEYKKYKSWGEYDVTFKIVILFPEDFRKVVDNHFVYQSKEERAKITAFTSYPKINGKVVPIMFTQTKMNLSPTNDDLGHELKHIINYEHRKKTGYNRFIGDCSQWK